MLASLRQKGRAVKRECHALYFAARDPRTPWYVKAFAAGIAAYALSPIDLIPDFIPVLGILDDLVLLPLAIVVVLKLIPAEVMAESRGRAAEAAARPASRGVTVVIVLIWIAALAVTGWLVYRWFGG
jgi:uncharacterized membrane protein YkvA (DUF1232 family)